MKQLSILLLSVILLNCSSNNSSEIEGDIPTISFDVEAVIDLPPNSDISSLVSFNGQSAATYTSELELNEVLNVGRPDGLLAGDVLEYYDVVIKNANGVALDFDDNTFISDDGNLKILVPDGKPVDYYENHVVDVFEIQAINQSTSIDIEYKYDMEVYITRGGTTYGPYLIDPKIKIRRTR